jgi:hypothetical protein
MPVGPAPVVPLAKTAATGTAKAQTGSQTPPGIKVEKTSNGSVTQYLTEPLMPPMPKGLAPLPLDKTPPLVAPAPAMPPSLLPPSEKNPHMQTCTPPAPSPAVQKVTQVTETPALAPPTASPIPAQIVPPKPEPVPVVQPAQTRDFRESWGKPVEPPRNGLLQTLLPHANDQRPDPILNPEKYGKEPGDNKAVGPMASPAGPPMFPPTPAASAAADLPATVTGAPPDAAKSQQRWRLFGNRGRTIPDNAKELAPAAPTQNPSPNKIVTPGVPAGKMEPMKAPTAPANVMPEPMKPDLSKPSTQAMPEIGGPMPMGAASVVAAHNGAPGAVQLIPVPVVTLPGTTRPPDGNPPQPPEPQMPQPPQAPQLNQPKNSMWVNAFTTADPSQTSGQGPVMMAYPYPGRGYAMTPSYMYGRSGAGMLPPSPYAPVAAAAVIPPNMLPSQPVAMNAPGAGMPTRAQNVIAASYNSPMPPNEMLTGMLDKAQPVPQMLNMLRDSLYPSHREWAADNLASCDWRSHPHVVRALVDAASKDPAATVRAGCVRALARMKVNTVPVISTIKSLRVDPDPRVRTEVGEALACLAPTGTPN